MYQINKTDFWSVFKLFQKINLGFIGFLILLFILIKVGLFGYMPDLEEIKNPTKNLATNVYSSDYELLGSYYIQNRTEVKYEELSPWLIKALIATEDKRFYEHCGIDLKGIFRAIVFLGRDGGASTLTQQTAKNLFYENNNQNKFQRIIQKLKEQVIAIQLEKNFSKEEIIALYFNTVSFNNNAYGIKTAAKTYFNKNQKDLKVEEAAMLVGMLKGPSLYNPKRNPKTSLNRRNTVIELMANQEIINLSQSDSIKKIPIKLDFRGNKKDEGLATYFRDQLFIDLKKWTETHKKPDGTRYSLNTDGLQVYTTLNYKMQQYAEEAAMAHLKKMQAQFFKEWRGKEPWKSAGERSNPKLIEKLAKKTTLYISLKEKGLSEEEIKKELALKKSMTIFTWEGDRDTLFSTYDSLIYYAQQLQTGFLVLDPRDGGVKAWVGGADFTYSQNDHVRIGTKRQVGSTMKPILYATAMDKGLTPESTVPYTCPNIPSAPGWCPKGTGRWAEGEMVSLREGLKYSDNLIAAQVMKEVGPDAVVATAKRLNIISKLDAVPALALGVSDISVIEMAGAYTTLANRGVYSKPYYITRITDKDGHILDEFFPQRSNVMSEKTVFEVVSMMRGVVTGGTATALGSRYGLRMNIAGKTGTTQSNTDAWFAGFTPELLGVVWVGCDEPSSRFATTSSGQGAVAALPIWGSFFRKVYNDRTLHLDRKASFRIPEGFSTDTTGALIPIVVDTTANLNIDNP